MGLASLTGSGQMSGTLLGVMLGFNEFQDLRCNPLHNVMIISDHNISLLFSLAPLDSLSQQEQCTCRAADPNFAADLASVRLISGKFAQDWVMAGGRKANNYICVALGGIRWGGPNGLQNLYSSVRFRSPPPILTSTTQQLSKATRDGPSGAKCAEKGLKCAKALA